MRHRKSKKAKYFGKIVGDYEVVGQSQKTWNNRFGFAVKNIKTGITKDVSWHAFYIMRMRAAEKKKKANTRKI